MRCVRWQSCRAAARAPVVALVHAVKSNLTRVLVHDAKSASDVTRLLRDFSEEEKIYRTTMIRAVQFSRRISGAFRSLPRPGGVAAALPRGGFSAAAAANQTNQFLFAEKAFMVFDLNNDGVRL